MHARRTLGGAFISERCVISRIAVSLQNPTLERCWSGILEYDRDVSHRRESPAAADNALDPVALAKAGTLPSVTEDGAQTFHTMEPPASKTA